MKYGFIGCGNMGGSIAKALSNSTKDILLADPTEKAAILAQQLGCACADNETVVNTCDCVFLAVKPQVMADVLAPLRPCFEKNKPLVVSMAAGITVGKIESLIGTSLPVIRIMPNTPVAVGAGMILYCHNALVDEAMLEAFLKDAAPCGQWDLLDEALIDAAGVVSGCGPAYMYQIIEALADGAVLAGLPRAMAYELAAQTMAGAAMMVLETGAHPGVLKDQVTSPGGTTIRGIQAMEAHGVRNAMIDAVQQAYIRSKELGEA